MTTDFASLYAAGRDRVTDLVRDLPPDAAEKPVPGCPSWTVRELVSHLAGVASDVATGVTPTGGLDEWTAAQVEKRQGVAIPDLLDEWAAAGVEQVIPNLPGPFAGILVVDVVTHEHDLRAAVDRPYHDDPAALLAVRGYTRMLGGKIDQRGLPALRIETPEWSGVAGSGEPAVTLRGSSYEVFRTLAGRRSEADVRALDWDGDPAPYLDVLSAFGPLPATSGG